MTNILIICIVITSLVVILSNKIEISVFALILTFALSGILFINIGVPFFGFIYLLVYTAAISILFLFVIMMLDLPNNTPSTNIRNLSTSQSQSIVLFYIVGFVSLIFILFLGLNLIFYPNNDLTGLITSTKAIDSIMIYHQEWSIQSLDVMQGLAYTLYTEQASLLLTLVFILLLVMVALISHLYKPTNLPEPTSTHPPTTRCGGMGVRD